jgi:hypothetical protein
MCKPLWLTSPPAVLRTEAGAYAFGKSGYIIVQGYAAIGYQSKGTGTEDNTVHIIYDNRSFFPVYSQDILWAKRSILIVSPFIKQQRVSELLQILQAPLGRKVEVTVVTRPADDFTDKHKLTFKQSVRAMQDAGIAVIFKPKIHQKLAVIDQKTVWYGSINFLSFGTSEESMMRIVSGNIALELIDSLSIESVPSIQEEILNPSEVKNNYWVFAGRKTGNYPKPNGKSGKWLIFVSIKKLDYIWHKIRVATENGLLGYTSKAATAMLNPNASDAKTKVICVYTYDWSDEIDVKMVREELRALGITQKIPYKTDSDTDEGKYASTGARLSKYYE